MSKISNMLSNGKFYAINAVDCCEESEKNRSTDNAAGSMFSWQLSGELGTSIVGNEVVDHPSHYAGKNGIEAIDVIDAYDLNFNMGSALKYILRCGKKDDAIIELEKAIWYLKHEVELRKQGKERMQNGQ